MVDCIPRVFGIGIAQKGPRNSRHTIVRNRNRSHFYLDNDDMYNMNYYGPVLAPSTTCHFRESAPVGYRDMRRKTWEPYWLDSFRSHEMPFRNSNQSPLSISSTSTFDMELTDAWKPVAHSSGKQVLTSKPDYSSVGRTARPTSFSRAINSCWSKGRLHEIICLLFLPFPAT